MSVAVTSKAPREPKALEPKTRLTLTFRELAIDGRKSWKHCWVFARFAAESGDPDMQKIIDVFDGLKKREKATVTPEYVADLAGVSCVDFAAEVFREYYSFCSDAGNLIAAASHPDVVKKSVQIAKTADGWRDRKMLHEHSGFLPTKTGGGIHVNASANAETKTATVVQAPELPTMESDSLRFTRLLKDSQVSAVLPASEQASKVPALSAPEK